MKTSILLDAMETIDTKYIVSAQNRMGYCSEAAAAPHLVKRRRSARKTFVCIAAVIALLIASFTTAMAVSDDLREFVFSIFNLNTKEILPDSSGDVLPDGSVEQIGGGELDKTVSTYYFKGNGVVVANDGMLYAGEYGGADRAFYDLGADGLAALPTVRFQLPYSFRGTEFNLKFDYTVYQGTMFFHELPENLDENPLKYGWSLCSAGADSVWLLLPYETYGDYGVYPLLLHVGTGEITDVLEGLPLEGIIPTKWKFADDRSAALLSGYTEGYEMGYWLCDVQAKTLTPVSELAGREIKDCYLLEGRLMICYAANGSGFDVIRCDLNTGAVTMLVENTNYAYMTADGSGLGSIEYYGGQGRHALLFDGEGGVTLLDLRDGKRTPLEGIVNDGTLLTSESPDGEHVMFAFRDTSVFGALNLYQIGVLDTRTGVLQLLERANYEIRSERPMGWLGNNCITVIAFDENEREGWYLYVYDFR